MNPVDPDDLERLDRFYKKQAHALIKLLREQKGISYRELQRRLQAHGVDMELQALTNKVTRGTYPFSFALQLLAAMDVKNLWLPNALPNKDGVVMNALFSVGLHSASEAPERPHNNAKHLKRH